MSSDNSQAALIHLIRDNLSPQAVAVIAALLQCVKADPAVNREVYWLRGQMVESIGGEGQLETLCHEAGAEY
jgi:hypothetical protein